MGKRTPLYTQHLQENAKIINFGGWDMPLHYGSQLSEHQQVRRDAGMFDVSHMSIVDLVGKRVHEFLRYLLSNDVGRLKCCGKALYSCMLNDQGGVIDDLIVYSQEETQFRLVVNAATRDKDIAWIIRHAKNFAVHVKAREDLAMLAVQGPHAREKVKPFLPSDLQDSANNLAPFHACWNSETFIARTGYTGEDGFEIILPAKHIANLWTQLQKAGVAPIGLGARDSLRLEAGLRLYGADLEENYSPLESGLEWTVAWTPENRIFIGRDAIEEQRRTRKHDIMVGLVLLGKGVLRAHQTVYTESGEQGHVTSGIFSPTLGISIAFARLPAGQHNRVTVAIRNKQLLAQVVKPPFVREGKSCIELPKPQTQDEDEPID